MHFQNTHCNQVGFVFQAYKPYFHFNSRRKNIAFPMEWKRTPTNEITTKVAQLIETFGLKHRANHFPSQLSGGEQQRVAFARALANDPPLLLADEPTGNLDTQNGKKIIQILQTLKNRHKTVIVSTHDAAIMPLADVKLYLEEGKLAVPHD
jgi:putative ABC transport system ATP-binding protein